MKWKPKVGGEGADAEPTSMPTRIFVPETSLLHSGTFTGLFPSFPFFLCTLATNCLTCLYFTLLL